MYKDDMMYIGPSGEEAKESDDLILSKALQQKTFSSGVLILRPLKEKEMHLLKNDTLVSNREL